jgi:hypothetical protein
MSRIYLMMRDFKTRVRICSWHRLDRECWASALRLPFERVDEVVAITMAWSGSGSVAEEAGEVPCIDCSVSGPFSSRVLRAAKTIEPEDLWEATVGVHMHK